MLPKEVLIEFPDGSYIPASLAHGGNGITVYGFADSAVLPKISSPVLVSGKDLKIGQTALAISTDGFAATGIVARVSNKGIYTTLPDIGIGSAVVDLSGNIIGISGGSVSGFLISSNVITTLLTATTTAATSTAVVK